MATLHPLVISAPLGNYLQFPGTTATLGTFTAADRGGRPKALWRMFLTCRYYPRLKAWVNKLGLPNPGVDWYVARCQNGKINPTDKLVSIHGFSPADWTVLLDKVAPTKPMGLELNMSCPNIGHIGWPDDLFVRAKATGLLVVVKIPPINWEPMFAQARAAGITHFHCCNTLPSPNAHPNRGGGISGRPLKGVAMQVISQLRLRADFNELTIIGGGGIYEPSDVEDYAKVGVKHVAIATKLMNPKYLFSDAGIDGIRAKAKELLGHHGEAAHGHVVGGADAG